LGGEKGKKTNSPVKISQEREKNTTKKADFSLLLSLLGDLGIRERMECSQLKEHYFGLSF